MDRNAIMCRSFNPVGQGAFYTETFRIYNNEEEIHTVYDCGSTRYELIKERIESTFRKKEKIDAVFISHFHTDHVNGLEFLLNRCDVKRIFLPVLHTAAENLYLLQLKMTMEKSEYDFLSKFIKNPESVLKGNKSTQIIRVEQTRNHDSETEEEINSDPIMIDNESVNSNPLIIESGTPCKLEKNDFQWMYAPYNYVNISEEKATELLEKLKEELKKALEDPNIDISPENMPELYKSLKPKDKKEFEKFYSAISKDKNINSMVVYSGPIPEKTSKHQYFMTCGDYVMCNRCFCWAWHRDCINKVGCLYTGDYDAKKNWNKLEHHFRKYRDFIGTWQIPHHGAKSSYNKFISKENIHTAIISAGSESQYKHPHGEVVRDLLFKNINLLVVTEERHSQANFLIYSG